jgi:hypothetical protein
MSLFNVGTTRSREVLIIGFDAKAPSRYLANVKDQLHKQAQLEWDPGAWGGFDLAWLGLVRSVGGRGRVGVDGWV